jgi:carbon-monoxide dehydrogenase iron sulfur subunit
MGCIERHSESGTFPEFIWEEPPLISRIRVTEMKEKLLTLKCLHCKEPKCMAACKEDAITKIDGKVILDVDKCTGCWDCVEACPFKSIQKDEERNIAVKCDFCRGYEDQACVDSCPTDALMIVEVGGS